jgi:hypothetical protein
MNKEEYGMPSGFMPVGGKRPYHTPAFTVDGDVRDLTLGPSPGSTESGQGGTRARRQVLGPEPLNPLEPQIGP